MSQDLAALEANIAGIDSLLQTVPPSDHFGRQWLEMMRRDFAAALNRAALGPMLYAIVDAVITEKLGDADEGNGHYMLDRGNLQYFVAEVLKKLAEVPK